MLKLRFRTPSRFQEKVLSTALINYISKIYILMKDKNDVRKKIQIFMFQIVSNYDTSYISMNDVPDLLIN